MSPILLVLLILFGVGAVQAAIWIPVTRHWNKAGALFFADLEKEMKASGETMLRPPERGSFEGASDVYGMKRGTGKMLLTDRRLIFRKLSGGVVEIPTSKLRSVRESGSFLGGAVRGNRFLVLGTTDPADVGFVVGDRSAWKQMLEGMVSAPSKGET